MKALKGVRRMNRDTVEQKYAAGERNFQEVDLHGANLNEANLCEARLCGANLSDANLSGANLSGADLCEANLSVADLCVADLREADLSDANLSDADLREADLSGADLREADLSRADLRKANLSKANLLGTNLSGANLTGANLREAFLGGANLYGAKGFRFDGAPGPLTLRRQVADFIEANPKLHDQREWGDGSPDPHCKTPCCVAGWACHLGGGSRGASVSSAAWGLLWVDGAPRPPFGSATTRAEILAALRAAPVRKEGGK